MPYEDLMVFINQKQPPEKIYKKGILKNFAKVTGKYLCQSPFLNKDPGLGPAWGGFSCKLWQLYKGTFLPEHLQKTASNYWWNVS